MLESALLPRLGTTGIDFRRAELDAATIDVCRACSRYRRTFTEYRDASDWASSLVWERDADRERALFIVTLNGADVGLVELVASGDTLAIALLLVAAPARFAGVGRKVTRDVEVAARSAGYRVLSLGVHAENSDAHAFWSRLGFSDCGFLGRGTEAVVQMERLLHPLPSHRASVNRSEARPENGA